MQLHRFLLLTATYSATIGLVNMSIVISAVTGLPDRIGPGIQVDEQATEARHG